MPTSGIYLITNTRNNLVYVGKTKNLKKRKREHFSLCFAGRTLIDSAIAAEPENFKWEVIKECPIEDLDYYEQYYIYYLDAMNHGYNRSFGGEPGPISKYGEDHHATYYTNDEMLEIRKLYVNHSIKELYDIYKKHQSFSTFKNQILFSYSNLPRYNKEQKKWIYPEDWEGGEIKVSRKGSTGDLKEDEIMEVRRLSMTKTNDEILKERGLGTFKSERHLRDVINGTLYKWLPYFSRDNQQWIYPDNWDGPKEKEIDDENWMSYFYQKEKKNGRKLSNYQVLQIRYLYSLGNDVPIIAKKLKLKDVCSNDAIKLLVNNKTYMELPYLSPDKSEWICPDNLTEVQKNNFPKFIKIIQEDLKE